MPKPKPITLRTKKADIQKELKRHGVEFEQSALKVDLISLYQSEVLGKAPQFSSDDEDSIATISKSTMTMRSVKEEQLQGESVVVLESLLNQIQDDSGDAVVRRSPRKRKKPLRFMEDIESQTNQLTVSLARIDGMDGEDVSSFTNKKLMAELKKRGARVGPVGPTTRKIYERKLMKLMAGEKEEAAALDHSDEESSEEEVEVARTPVTRRRREIPIKEEYTSVPDVVKGSKEPPKPTPPRLAPRFRRPLPETTLFQFPNKVESDQSSDWMVADNVTTLRRPTENVAKDLKPTVTSTGDAREPLGDDDSKDSVKKTRVSFDERHSVHSDSDREARLTPKSATDSDASDDYTAMNAGQTPYHFAAPPKSRTPKVHRSATFSPMTRGLLSPRLTKSEYTKRIKAICDSATKRRPLHQKSPKAETSVKEPVVPAPSAGEQAVKSRSRVPLWVKIGVVLIVAVFLYFVYVSMEENSRKLLFMKTK